MAEAHQVPEVPNAHPRILFTPASLGRLASSLDDPALAELVALLRVQADAALAAPVPRVLLPDDLLLPGGRIWDARYPANTESFERHEAMMAPLRRLFAVLPPVALMAALEAVAGGANRAYLDYALAAMTELAGIDLQPSSYLNTHQFHGVAPALGTSLDLLWDLLDAGRRDAIVAALVARATELYQHSLLAAFEDTLGSHNIVYGPPEMLVCALALYHHVPAAAQWLADVRRFVSDYFPSYGGADGGWGQGFGYVYTHYLQRMAHILEVAVGENHFDRPWARGNGRHFLYFRPPWRQCTSFGDASYSINLELNRQVMSLYARVYGDGVYQWYADWYRAHGDGDAPVRDPMLHLSLALHWPPPPVAQPPGALPASVHLSDTGWVALHSDLSSQEADIMLCFKSSRYGSFSHSHPDQNSFVLEAFGNPLLIDTGYYPWYGSAHDLGWTRLTKSHNAVLFDHRGQGRWNLDASGPIVAFATSDQFDYCAGDATAAYQAATVLDFGRELQVPDDDATEVGVLRAVRHVLYLRPDLFVIVDDVETKEPVAVQLMWYSPTLIAVASDSPAAQLRNGEALAEMRWMRRVGEAAELTCTDQFAVAPERVRGNEFPDQWDLTANFTLAERRQLLVTTIAVGRAGAALPSPEIELSRHSAKLDWLELLTVKWRAATTQLRISEHGSSVSFQPDASARPMLESFAPPRQGR